MGCERLSFLDAYSGYHQIKMAVKDQENTTFITPFGAFCYVSMPCGLKSAQATYQRCVQNCLHDQIGCNVHAYVDDIVVKSREKETLIDDLKETFDNLRIYKMMLNLAKCVFGVPAGKLLCLTEALKLIRRRSRQLPLWLNRHASMMFSDWRVVLLL